MAVLKKGSRGPKVKDLKRHLNEYLTPAPGLDDSDLYDDDTFQAVGDFQTANHISPRTGQADPHTLLVLGDKIAIRAGVTASVGGVPGWLRNFMSGLPMPGPTLAFMGQVFFEHYIPAFGHLTPTGSAALGRLLAFIEDDPAVNDVRWAAYMLATVLIECGPEYTPIPEKGCRDGRTPVCTPIPGNSRAYGNPVACPNTKLHPAQPCPAGRTSHTYYGRGYVQLTHAGNYRDMDAQFGGDLVHFPEKVLDPDLAYKIMSFGMRNGSFTGKRLADFTTPRAFNYHDARKIINGLDRATELAGHGRKFEAILRASLI